jgi:hypothetical protein
LDCKNRAVNKFFAPGIRVDGPTGRTIFEFMTAHEKTVTDDELAERQRTFLERLRQHDHRVKVTRRGDALVFHGPVIGDGLMPPESPAEPVGSDDEAS